MEILGRIDTFITWFDGVVWGLPLIILILVTGIFLTVRLGLLQVRYLGKALKFMVKNEEDGHGEVNSFGALCTALSATIGTGNIVRSVILDDPDSIFRNGNKVFRRSSGSKIPYDR